MVNVLDDLAKFLNKVIVLPEVENEVIIYGLDKPRQFTPIIASKSTGCSLTQNHGRDRGIKNKFLNT